MPLSSDSGTQALTLTSVSGSNLSHSLLKMFLQGVIGPKIGGTERECAALAGAKVMPGTRGS